MATSTSRLRSRVRAKHLRRHAQCGQAMTEYIVAVGFLLVLLWVGANTSAVQQLVAALKDFWTHYSDLISLP